MSIQLFNTFDVKVQDFADISCVGCRRNGEHFDFLLLCADCGSFLCKKCMKDHMKNYDDNHNNLRARNSKLQQIEEEVIHPEITATVTHKEREKSETVDLETPSDFQKKHQEVKQEILLLQQLLDRVQRNKTGKLSSMLELRQTTFERITEFKENVTKELNNMEREIEDLVNLQIMMHSNTLQDDIAKTCQTITTVQELVDQIEQESKTDDIHQKKDQCESSKLEYLQNLLQNIRAVSIANDGNSLEVNIKCDMENIVRKPLEDFCYRVNKMQNLFANETGSED